MVKLLLPYDLLMSRHFSRHCGYSHGKSSSRKLSPPFDCSWSVPSIPAGGNAPIFGRTLVTYIHVRKMSPSFAARMFVTTLGVAGIVGDGNFHLVLR
jgi:hypothetical protein